MAEAHCAKNFYVNSKNSATLPIKICGYCKGEFKRNDAASHRKVCRKRPIRCPYCSYLVPREETKWHIGECRRWTGIDIKFQSQPAVETSATRQGMDGKAQPADETSTTRQHTDEKSLPADENFPSQHIGAEVSAERCTLLVPARKERRNAPDLKVTATCSQTGIWDAVTPVLAIIFAASSAILETITRFLSTSFLAPRRYRVPK